MTTRLLVGSGNRGKLAEYRELLAGLPYELVGPGDLAPPPPEPPEEAGSFAENAVAKALGYAKATGLSVVADDSGLEVAALRGAPGVRSRRFFGEDLTDAERNARLLALLDGVRDRSARFVCVIALATPGGDVETFEGEARGSIAERPRGTHGFGYDPLFLFAEGPDAAARTMAELSSEEKHRVSHRGRAAARLRARLAQGL